VLRRPPGLFGLLVNSEFLFCSLLGFAQLSGLIDCLLAALNFLLELARELVDLARAILDLAFQLHGFQSQALFGPLVLL
jgi:hypothetical protein